MIKLIVSAKDTPHRLSETTSLMKEDDKLLPKITIDSTTRYQKVIGFGGAFTESACYNLYRINEKLRHQALKLYFDPQEGIGYTMGRVSIHGCDFSLSSYTYVTDKDKSLKSFDIARDFQYVIPTIQKAHQLVGKKLKILASPWTPPAFMKDNDSPINGGHLLEEYADAWALYFVRFIQEYVKAGINIWGVTIQNEPAAVQRWDSCIYSPIQERDFLKHHLGPAFHDHGLADVKILIWDHNRDLIVDRVKPIFDDPDACAYAWGTAFHWYVSSAFENVGKVHELYPEKGLLFTEGCVEGGPRFNDWTTGERYATQMIGDFSNWCQGYLDWNLFLDNLGGPNHVNNLCDAPIIIDVFPEKLILQSSYYYIGHFSKFVKPGAYRIDSGSKMDGISQVAFQNPDGEIVLVVLNKSDQIREFGVCEGNIKFGLVSLPRSIMTIRIA